MPGFRDKSGGHICAICTLKFAMGHENSLAAPIWCILIQYGASISLVRAPLIFRCTVVPLRRPAFWKSYYMFCIQLTSCPRAASISSLLFLLSISIFRVFGENLEMPPKIKILLDPNQRTITYLLRSAPTEDIDVTDMPDSSSATPETEVSKLGSQQDVEMHNESDE